MPIKWRPQMSVGIKFVDDDHRQLLSIINDFELATRDANKSTEDILRTILDKLTNYAKEHFAREEQFQKDSGYEFYQENKEQHVILLASLKEFYENLFGGKLGSSVKARQDMAHFLNRWLIQHIIKVDLKMRDEVAAPMPDTA